MFDDATVFEVDVAGSKVAVKQVDFIAEVYHEIDVPLDMLQEGNYEFHFTSKTKGHALEALSPGSALFVTFEKAKDAPRR